MQFLGDLFNLFLLQPTINLTVLILRIMEGLHIPGSLGFSIILLTLFITALTWPFRTRQIRHTKLTSEKMIELKPEFDKLKAKHKDDKMTFEREKAALLKAHGVNPAAGCLPSLIPILFIYPIYQVILAFLQGQKGLEKINYFLYSSGWHLDKLPDPTFFGINLAASPIKFQTAGAFLLVIPLLTALMTFIQSRMMMPTQPLKQYPSDSPKEVKEKENVEDMMASIQPQMLYFMPLMVGVFAFQLPVGMALYWNIVTIIGIIQQYLITGWGGMASLLARFGIAVPEKRMVETKVIIERSGNKKHAR